MPTTTLDKLIVPTREDLVTRYKSDYSFRAPLISTAEGTLPDIDANVTADLLLPIYTESSRQADANTLAGMNSTQLDAVCVAMGIPTKLPAVGAAGFVIVSTSIGGANIPAGAEIRNLNTGLRYNCAAPGIYNSNGASPTNLVPVTGVDTGPSTNVNSGVTLTWTSPVPGLSSQATVFQNSDGSGLSGGSNQESDDEQRARITESRANPAVSGNDAAYQLAMTKTPGMAVQAPFTWPAILGPGTTGVAGLLRPTSPGAGRIMTTAQIGLMKSWVIGQMPKDDSSIFIVILPQTVDMVFSITWAKGTASWTDGTNAWPPRTAVTYPYTVLGGATPKVFQVTTADPGAVAPQAGQTIGFFILGNLVSAPAQVLVQKRILSVTGLNPWTITIDATFAASDVSYAPTTGQRVMPWSDSLSQIVSPVVDYFETLGPGEMLATFFDNGYRQQRSPPDPGSWPQAITTKMLVPIEELAAVQNVLIASPSTPFYPNVGVPGVYANLLTLNSISAYPI